MKRFFEYIGGIAIVAFSFVYTEKAAIIVQGKNPVMQSIVENESDYNVASVNATIEGNYIIPGSNGIQVNINKSFRKMRNLKVFNDYFLVLDEVTPDISLSNNKDKIIRKSNNSKNAISLIFESSSQTSEYAIKQNLLVNIALSVDNQSLINSYEYINGAKSAATFSNIETILNKHKLNKNICLINENNIELCKKNNKYLVESTHILDGSNLVTIKSHINNGDIIFIKDSANLSDLQIILQQIKYQGLSIKPLSDLISENS